MSNWQGFTLTENGLKLQAKVNAGQATLQFTKIAVGSGSSSSSSSRAELVKKEKDLTIASCTVDGSVVKIETTLNNQGVTTAFKEREMGLYARDPDAGEILFAYMTDNDPDTMPAAGSTTVISKHLTLALTFSNTGDVSAVLDDKQIMHFRDLQTIAADKEVATDNDSKAASTSWVRGLLNKWKSFNVSQISDFTKNVNDLISKHNSSESAHANRLQVTTTVDKPASMADKGVWIEIEE